MNRRDFIKNAAITIAGASIPLVALQLAHPNKISAKEPEPTDPTAAQKIVLFFDTHYRLDSNRAIPPYDVDAYNEMCNRTMSASLALRPDQVHLIGDLIDYNPAEWKLVKSQIQEMKTRHSDLKVYGIMGNHDYIYYRYKQFSNATFPSDLNEEIAFKVASPIQANMSTIVIDDNAKSAAVNHKMAIISRMAETTFPYKFDIVTAKSVNGSKIRFTPPVLHNYSAGDYVRQGWSNTRAKGYFRDAFINTETYTLTSPTNANYYTRAGNVMFIFISVNHFHPISGSRWMKLRPEELAWFEGLVADNYKKCNIIVYTHEPPGYAADIGYPPKYNNWSEDSVARFKQICRNYNIPLWISGHTHDNWRSECRIYRPEGYGNTVILIGPAAICHDKYPEDGEFLSMELTKGTANVVINAHSVNLTTGELNQPPLRTTTISLPYAIDMTCNVS